MTILCHPWKNQCFWVFKFTLKSSKSLLAFIKSVNFSYNSTSLSQVLMWSYRFFIFTFYKSTDTDIIIKYSSRKANISELLAIFFQQKPLCIWTYFYLTPALITLSFNLLKGKRRLTRSLHFCRDSKLISSPVLLSASSSYFF